MSVLGVPGFFRIARGLSLAARGQEWKNENFPHSRGDEEIISNCRHKFLPSLLSTNCREAASHVCS